VNDLPEAAIQQPDIACIAILAWSFTAFFAFYAFRRPADRPFIFRPMSLICAAGALYYSDVLLGERHTAQGAAVETQLLDVFVIFLYGLICWRTCQSIGQSRPALYGALRSALVILPSVYALTLFFAWQFPPPELPMPIENSGQLPTLYFLTRLHLVFLAAYATVLAFTFFAQATDPVVPLRKRKIQMLFFAAGSVCLALIPINTAVRNSLQVVVGPLDPGLIRLQLWLVSAIIVAGGAFFLIGLVLQGAKTRRDKALELVLRWSETRYEIERHLFRLVYANPGVRLAEIYLADSASVIPTKRYTENTTQEGSGLHPDDRTKAELTFKYLQAEDGPPRPQVGAGRAIRPPSTRPRSRKSDVA
jgi:hypothetical protein